MTTDARLLEIVDVIYAAAVQPVHWDEALTLLARACGARAAGIRVERASVTQRWVGLEAKFDAAYVEHYWRHDPWVAPARAMAPGAAGFGEMIVPRRTLERNAFYNELSKPYGLDDLVGGVVSKTDMELVTVGVMGATNVRFGERQKAVVERLLPHLRRAIAIGDRLCSAPVADGASELEGRLQRAYALTPAEARVAVRIGRGLVPKEVASTLGTSWNTVRSQLRAVFAKTGTRRQTELALLVAKLDAE